MNKTIKIKDIYIYAGAVILSSSLVDQIIYHSFVRTPIIAATLFSFSILLHFLTDDKKEKEDNFKSKLKKELEQELDNNT